MADAPENPSKKTWSSAEYKRRKAMRDREGNEPKSSDQSQTKSDSWDKLLNSPEIRRFAEEEARKRQMVSNAFQQAANSKPPKKPTSPKRLKNWRRKPAQPPARALNRYRLFRWLAGHPKISGWSGLAVVATSLGFELGIAAKFALLCYGVAWVVWVLAIYFSRFWDKKRVSAIASMIILGLALVGFWWLFLPEPQPLPPTAKEIAAEINKGSIVPMVSNATMHISDERLARTSFPLKAGQIAAVNFYPVNDGPGVAHNFHNYGDLGFIQRGSEEEIERAVDAMFQEVYRRVNKSTQDGEKGSEISPNDATELFFTVGQNSITAADALAFNGKKKVLVAIARIEWDNTRWAERCVYFLPEQVQGYLTSADHKIIWNLCKGHNDSGIRRSGSLL